MARSDRRPSKERNMKFRKLGASDLEVSEISLGSWLTYGVGVKEDLARACVDKAFDLGINFIDTANVYGRGAAESVLGETLAGRKRDSYILATKVFGAMSDTDKGLSRAQILKQMDASLKRLRTDYVDLYQCHRYDADTPLEETMEALSQVVREGKARWIGFSEWSPDQIAAAFALPGVERFVSSQPQYSLLWRRPEAKVIPLCAANGVSQIVWSPLAQGRLGDAAAADPRAAAVRDALEALGAAHGVSRTVAAYAWLMAHPAKPIPIVGSQQPARIAEAAKALAIQIDRAAWYEVLVAARGAPLP